MDWFRKMIQWVKNLLWPEQQYFGMPISSLTAPQEGRSPHWPKVRAAHLLKEPTCQWCGRRDHLNVHHIKPFHLFPELELEESNLITLCEPPGADGHHLEEGHFGSYQEGYNLVIRQQCEERQQRVANRKNGGVIPAKEKKS